MRSEILLLVAVVFALSLLARLAFSHLFSNRSTEDNSRKEKPGLPEDEPEEQKEYKNEGPHD